MPRRLVLSPHGTARAQFAAYTGRADAAARAGDLDAFFRNLADGARAHDLGDESLYLAEELVGMQWSLGDRQRRALALLILATMIHVKQGSTRLPLSRKQDSPLGRVVASLAEASGLEVELPVILRDIDKLVRAVTFDQIIGRDGDYRPLIVADDCAYQHRMWWCERRLADRLRARLDDAAPSVTDDLSGSRTPPSDSALREALAAVLARPAVIGGRSAGARPAARRGVPVQLSDEQVSAVKRAVTAPLTVISGGPGTGKTAIVVSMLRVLRRLGEPVVSIALAAPTGKAANRMWTSIRTGLEAVRDRQPADDELLAAGLEPQTLHRLLGYLPFADRFRHHENSPLSASTVIVDEASMIDLVLMERLLRSVRPGARLILLGDADQLPSVDAGAVLRDLVAASQGRAARAEESREPFAVRLTHSYRMDPADPHGRAILLAARAVNTGKADALLGASKPEAGAAREADATALTIRATPEAIRYEGVELYETGGAAARAASTTSASGPDRGEAGDAPTEATARVRATTPLARVRAFVDDWYYRRVFADPDFHRLSTHTYRLRRGAWADGEPAKLAALAAIYERSRLLAVTRRLPTGAEAINRRIHARVLRASSIESRPDYYPGEPVMMRHNDYERGLFNGDQGLVVRASEDGGPQHFRVVFPRVDGWAVFHLDALRAHIELSFAMTVHKSQGSEFDHVAIVLPADDIPLLTREMLYTAITRARRSVVVCGDRALLRLAIGRPGERYSGLADRVAAAPRSERGVVV